MPEFLGRIDLAAAMDDEVKWQMNEGVVPAAHQHVGFARHGGMHGVLGKA